MTPYQVRTLQARCAALGFWPGPIDGKMGPRTRAAEAAAREAQSRKGLPLVHPSGITRVHWHWTAGGHQANSTDRAAYHGLIEGDGRIVWAAPDAAVRAHTRNANTGAIGLSMCCMVGAIERPFTWGGAPMTAIQLQTMVRETARICRQYDIPPTRWSTLSHAEVQPSLGIVQSQKWDITVLPGMERPGDPLTVGDKIRDMLRRELGL